MAINHKPASASHDLLLVERADPFPPKLEELLLRKGFTLKNAGSPEDAAQLLPSLANPIMLVDCGSRAGARDYVKSFYSQPSLHQVPMLVLGRDVDGLEEELKSFFRLATTIKTPCAPQDALDAINYLALNYHATPSERKTQHSRNRGERSPAPPQGSTDEEGSPSASHTLYSQFDSVPSLFFHQLQKFNIIEQSLEGGSLPALNGLLKKISSEVFPRHETSRALCQKALEDSGKWVSQHLLRVAFLTDRILRPFALDPELLEAARGSCFLSTLASDKRNRALLRKEYIGRGALLLRKDICSLFKDSALQLATTYHLDRESKVVASLARLIGREEVASDDPLSVVASAIMLADLTDRVCFQSGHWNPRAAYALLRRIKAGKFRDIHPAVLCCLAKILSEAISSISPAFLLPKNVRESAELRNRAKENQQQLVSIHEAKVPLAELTPGMKLSQPLFAYDGRQLLDEDLILDQDLIWRIWQLSAVRPINAPVVVLRKKQSAPSQH